MIFYVFCLVVVRPPPKYRLPRRIISINEVFSYCYQSRLLDDIGVDGKPVFSAQDIGEGREHLEARIHLAKKEYQFGLYLGKDGRGIWGLMSLLEMMETYGSLSSTVVVDSAKTGGNAPFSSRSLE
jgi:hypothetical protein